MTRMANHTLLPRKAKDWLKSLLWALRSCLVLTCVPSLVLHCPKPLEFVNAPNPCLLNRDRVTSVASNQES